VTQQLIPFLFALAGGALGALLGHLWARKGVTAIQAETTRVSTELLRSEARIREQVRIITRMQGEQATVAGVIRQLPDVVRELNRSDLESQAIPSLLFSMTQDIFQPEQILLYLVRNPGDEEEPADQLYLRHHRGLGDPAAVRRVRVGEGKIGWVAENKVEMLVEDWLNQTRTEGRSVPENHPALRLDMIGPLVHYGDAGAVLLGVLCVGLPHSTSRPRDEKRLLQLITGLGSIALMNAKRVDELRAKANHDGLTGLLNKRHFMEELGNLIHKAELENQPLGIFIFDIDHFKKYNDTNGHLQGDDLLKTMAKVVKRNLKGGDLASRYGGEEFLVAMPHTDKNGAMAAARRIQEAIASHPFPQADKQPLGKVTISGGVAAFPVDGTDSGDLIRGADRSLYDAKRGGRNRVLPYRGVEIGDTSAGERHEVAASATDPASDR